MCRAYLNREVILQVDSVKYLGHLLTNDLHDDLDIRSQCRSINVPGNILFRKLCSLSVKLNLFNSYCASMYSSLVVEQQENINLQVANNLSQHTKSEHWIF